MRGGNLTLLLQLLSLEKEQLQQKLPTALPKALALSAAGPFGQSVEDGCSHRVYEADSCAPESRWWAGPGLKPGFARLAAARTIRSRRSGFLPDGANVRSKRNALRCASWLWPEGRVPLDLSGLGDPLIRQRLNSAIAEIHGLSCVRFEDAAGTRAEGKVVRVEAVDKGCRATVGLASPKPYVNLSPDCTRGQVLHELMHVLGFGHEHTRPDREDFVNVLCDNIKPTMTTDFRRLRADVVEDFGEPYDFYSIMHYRLDHFTRNGLDTLEPLVEVDRRRVGLMEELSEGDVRKLNALYQCPDE